jgi:hypothetical protein
MSARSACFVLLALILAPFGVAKAEVAVSGPSLTEISADKALAGGATKECLAQLGIAQFDAFRSVIHCLQAWTEYNPQTCDPISEGSYTVLVQPQHGTISTKTIGPYSLGNGLCPGRTYSFHLARYNWTDKKKTATQDAFTIQWFTPDGIFRYNFNHVAVLAPRITGPTEVWWFDDERPNEGVYPTRLRLTAEPSGYTYRWTKVLEGDGDIEVVPQGATTGQVTSSHASSNRRDVCVEASTDVSGPSNPFCLTVRAPTLQYRRTNDRPATSFGQPVGYESQVHYRIRDQFNTILPTPIPWNEQFTSGVVRDYVCNAGVPTPCPNWNRGAEVGGTVDPNDAVDHVSIWATGFNVLRPNPKFPSAGSDALTCDSAGQKMIDHWTGEWRIGSADAGVGLLAETLIWQRYTDHARHCNQRFPRP